MSYERLEKDVKMMQETGINVVRIAESTWGTVKTQDDVFDFSHIDLVFNAMNKGILGYSKVKYAKKGNVLLSNQAIATGSIVELEAWGVKIVEED